MTELSKDEILTLLKKRERSLKKRIKKERESLNALRHKSRRIRLSSAIGPRVGYFTDKLQELQNTIQLLTSAKTKEEFLTSQNGDELDTLLSVLNI